MRRRLVIQWKNIEIRQICHMDFSMGQPWRPCSRCLKLILRCVVARASKLSCFSVVTDKFCVISRIYIPILGVQRCGTRIKHHNSVCSRFNIVSFFLPFSAWFQYANLDFLLRWRPAYLYICIILIFMYLYITCIYGYIFVSMHILDWPQIYMQISVVTMAHWTSTMLGKCETTATRRGKTGIQAA